MALLQDKIVEAYRETIAAPLLAQITDLQRRNTELVEINRKLKAALETNPNQLDEFQRGCLRTWNNSGTVPDRDRLAHAAMGLSGEAGESAEVVKKYLFLEQELNREDLAAEIGDAFCTLPSWRTKPGSRYRKSLNGTAER